MLNLTIRDERPEDFAAVYEVNRLAFGREDEANLVAGLRPLARPFISLVAIFDETVVGHLLFTRVNIQGEKFNKSTLDKIEKKFQIITKNMEKDII